LGPLDFEATATQPIAPGVTDDGSGTAAVMELARVMSQYQFDKTIVFIAFAAEEIGLSGSQAYAAMAKRTGMQIEAVLNNDIIGSDVSGNGRSAGSVLRLFAAGPEDSPSREVGRYMQQIAQRFVPSMQVEMVFRQDRFYARRRPHALPESGLSRGAADHGQREFQESAHHHRYFCQHFGGIHHTGRPHERRDACQPGACAGAA
jgi:Zn-dependent M28 family amino/carboxypeptidase